MKLSKTQELNYKKNVKTVEKMADIISCGYYGQAAYGPGAQSWVGPCGSLHPFSTIFAVGKGCKGFSTELDPSLNFCFFVFSLLQY